ncbi:MAG TPA: hypothetical protein VL981_01840 [Candidatus Methylacidiphilales bacterium]|nr:hypothetical protein [Candidatus Methylacidiphilales bacterium]
MVKMATFPDSLKEFINVAALKAYTKTVEAELKLLKELHEHLGLNTGGGKPGKPKSAGKVIKRSPPGGVKKAVLAYLQKNSAGKAIEIAKLSGLKVTSVNQTLYGLKKSGHVTQAKKRGSPFVLAKK